MSKQDIVVVEEEVARSKRNLELYLGYLGTYLVGMYGHIFLSRSIILRYHAQYGTGTGMLGHSYIVGSHQM